MSRGSNIDDGGVFSPRPITPMEYTDAHDLGPIPPIR